LKYLLVSDLDSALPSLFLHWHTVN